jgi:hypothetical protein
MEWPVRHGFARRDAAARKLPGPLAGGNGTDPEYVTAKDAKDAKKAIIFAPFAPFAVKFSRSNPPLLHEGFSGSSGVPGRFGSTPAARSSAS